MCLVEAQRIVGRVGPATVLVDAAAEPGLARELALLGCPLRAPGGEARLGVLRWPAGDTGAAIAAGAGQLAVLSAPGERIAVEGWLAASGWRLHPASVTAAEVGALTADSLPPVSHWSRAAAPVDDGERAWHAVAAERVRSGDRVLVAGPAAGPGAAIVAALSRAAAVIEGEAEPAWLDDQPARSADLVILAVDDPARIHVRLLAAAARVVKRDGRLVLGWRSGDDAACVLADRFFLTETCVVAGNRWLLTASVDPLGGGAADYVHPAFHAAGQDAGATLVDLAGAYDNPHLYRTMVQIGERLGDEVRLARLAEDVLATARAGSVDRGAAICVLGYRALDARLPVAVPGLLALIDGYMDETAAARAPHVVRWRLSLLFLAGRLCELADAPADALGWYERASLADWAGFSPLLATKAVAACFMAARLLIAVGEHDAALARFRRGLDTALAAAAAPHARLIGNPDRPIPFYCQEMAEVLDMGGQCAVALANAPLLARDPGLFWRQVDIRRFGLFAWANDLQRQVSG